MFPGQFVPLLLQLPERIAWSSPAARLWPLDCVCGQRVDDACWQRPSRQSGSSSLGALTLVWLRYANTPGQRVRGHGMEISQVVWNVLGLLSRPYTVCVIH